MVPTAPEYFESCEPPPQWGDSEHFAPGHVQQEGVMGRPRKLVAVESEPEPEPDEEEGESDLKYVDKPPAPRSGGTSWMETLLPLTTPEGRGRWARVKVFDLPEQANWAQNNLARRANRIPDPDGEWEFAARAGVLYAKYVTPSPKARSLRSTRTGRVAKK